MHSTRCATAPPRFKWRWFARAEPPAGCGGRLLLPVRSFSCASGRALHAMRPLLRMHWSYPTCAACSHAAVIFQPNAALPAGGHGTRPPRGVVCLWGIRHAAPARAAGCREPAGGGSAGAMQAAQRGQLARLHRSPVNLAMPASLPTASWARAPVLPHPCPSRQLAALACFPVMQAAGSELTPCLPAGSALPAAPNHAVVGASSGLVPGAGRHSCSSAAFLQRHHMQGSRTFLHLGSHVAVLSMLLTKELRLFGTPCMRRSCVGTAAAARAAATHCANPRRPSSSLPSRTRCQPGRPARLPRAAPAGPHASWAAEGGHGSAAALRPRLCCGCAPAAGWGAGASARGSHVRSRGRQRAL